MKILAIECSAIPASVAVCEDGKLLSEVYSNVALTHSQMLMPMIESALKFACTDIENIDGFAIAHGPGSFTGVRIGISTVKGLVAANGKKVAPISALEAMAHHGANFDGLVAPLMDARCAQCYCALFLSKNGTLTRILDDSAMSVTEFYTLLTAKMQELGKPCLLVGDGAKMFKDGVATDDGNIILAPDTDRYQTARYVAKLGETAHKNGTALTGGELLPMYLRLPQAERELKAKQNAKQGDNK